MSDSQERSKGPSQEPSCDLPRVTARHHSVAGTAAPRPPAPPLSAEELRAVWLKPHLLVEQILGQRERLMSNVVEQRHLMPLLLALAAASLVMAIPYGAVPPIAGFWKIAVLFTGSVLICFPSLYVFAQYLGFRLTLAQALAITLVVSATAGIFCLGFSPILGFVALTTSGGLSATGQLSNALLATSLALGIVQLGRCLAHANLQVSKGGLFVLVAISDRSAGLHHRAHGHDPRGRVVKRLAGAAVLASAAYGFSAGSVHSLKFALRNLVKFPLLLVLTCLVCSIAWFVCAQFVSRSFGFAEVQRLAARIFHDLAVLLASLSPACLLLALTLERPDANGLNEYPLFLGLNVLFIAVSGALALVRQAREVLERHALGVHRSLLVVGSWLALSLLVGGQAAWYLRPFYGVATVDAPFFLGTRPDHRGATSFYEAVWHVVQPPRR
ncbi:MAG: hypothetical protein QM765_05250 [Myxococcales bacterium]